MNLPIGNRINWIIGADANDRTGPVRTGTVYATYPRGLAPYWVPFLMAVVDRDEETLDSLLNPAHRVAVQLSNPTLTGVQT